MIRDSKIFWMSARAVLAFLVVATCCILSLRSVVIVEPLYSGFLICLGAYLGKTSNTTNPPA